MNDPDGQDVSAPIAAPRKLKFAVRTALTFALVVVTADYALRVVDLDRKSYGEGPILAMVERLRAEPISSAWLQGPDYTLSCYGPAYYLAFDWMARAGGWRHSIVPGRLVSLLAALLAAGLAALAVARLTHNAEMALLAPLLFLVSPTVSYWIPYARVDMLALPFALGAYLALGREHARMIAPAALIAAGSLVKPTIALTALPILAYLLTGRRWRDAVRFSLLVALLGALAWGLTQWTSRGFFLTAVLSGNRNPMFPWRGYAYGYEFMASPLGALAGITAAYGLMAEPAKSLRSPYALGFLISAAISTITICKRGSDRNYFLEPALLASVVIAAQGAPRFCAAQPRRALIALAALALLLAVPSLRELKTRGQLLAEGQESYTAIRRYLGEDATNARVLADGDCVDLALDLGCPLVVNDSYLFTMLVANGELDDQPILDEMQQGGVKWLLLDHTIEGHRATLGRNPQMWPAAVIESMDRNYELVEREGAVFLYRRRGG